MVQDQREKAEYLNQALVAGISSVEDAVSWAESVIELDDQPDAEVIEVALSRRRPDFAFGPLLDQIKGKCDRVQVTRKVLAELLARLNSDPTAGQSIASRVYKLYAAGYLPDDIFGWEPCALEDNFYLENVGALGPGRTAVGELRSYLARHCAAERHA